MNRSEILALGVPEENVKKFQELYIRDVRKAAAHQANGSAKAIRAAISSMLPLIHNEDILREILAHVTGAYCNPSAKEGR